MNLNYNPCKIKFSSSSSLSVWLYVSSGFFLSDYMYLIIIITIKHVSTRAFATTSDHYLTHHSSR